MAKRKATETEKALAELGIGAIFFACRSCEYLKVPQAEKRRTDILKLRNIRFFKKGREISHSNPWLEYADRVAVTFEFQKKDEKNDTVTQHCTHDVTLNPTRAWATLVRRIRSYPGATDDTPVSAVWRNGRMEHITSKEMVKALRAAVVAVGEEKLGFKKEDIGTHSIRSGAAMSMALDQLPAYSIMMIGRWSSDAFLRYIRKEVDMFTNNVSNRMLKHEFFMHTSGLEPRVSHHDPRQRNHRDNAETRRNISGNSALRARLPAIALYC